MFKFYVAVLIALEVAAAGLVSYLTSEAYWALLLTPAAFLTGAAVFILRRRAADPSNRAKRLSPEDIVRYRSIEEERQEDAATLSRTIVERAGEIRRTLIASPSEVQVEMCALGYRACVNDMITLTHLASEQSKTAGPIKRLKLRRQRRLATDALTAAREALPPNALRTTRQEH
jgi:preprotein translocase subunit Sec61beta